jgi:hypothetical protein
MVDKNKGVVSRFMGEFELIFNLGQKLDILGVLGIIRISAVQDHMVMRPALAGRGMVQWVNLAPDGGPWFDSLRKRFSFLLALTNFRIDEGEAFEKLWV